MDQSISPELLTEVERAMSLEIKIKDDNRKVLNLYERVEVLRHIDSGTSYRKIAQIFGVGRTQIANIFKRKSEILEDYENDVPGNRKRRKGGLTRNCDVNKLCYAWYKEACAQGMTVTGGLLQKKAREFAMAVNNDTFKASNGWLDSFRTRHNIMFGKKTPGTDCFANRTETFDTWKGERIVCDDKIEECNRTILPVQSENTQQPAESTVLPSSSNSNFQMFIVDNSGSSDVNNSCIVSQNSATQAYQNSPELASNVKHEPVDAYTESQDSTQNSVENNDSQTNAFPPIVYGNVNLNNHNRTNMEEVTSSSILNKTHVNQEKPTFDSTPMMVLAPTNNVQQIILSGNMGVNSSQNMGGNSSSHLFSNQVSVPSLQTTNTTRTVELNKNQGLEPQLDSTECRSKCFDILKDALQNTMSRLEDLGGEVAAWVVIPNENNSSLIHHMGSKKGREFINSKPDIEADLCDFLKTKKDSRRKVNRRKTTKMRFRLDEESCTLENMETVPASSDVEPLENIAKNNAIPCISLNDCKPTDVVFSVKGSDDDSSCPVVRQRENLPKEEELQVNAPRMASPRQNVKQNLKRKISSVYMDQLSDDESLPEPLEETKASLVERCEKLFSDKYALATFKEKAEFPYKLLKLRGKPWFTLSGFPEDLLPFRHPSEYDNDSLKRIMENKDKIEFLILHRKLSEAYYNKEACENKTKLALQKRISQDSIQPTKSSSVADEDMETFIKTIELEVSKSFESQKDEQESYSALKDEKFTKILTSPLQSSDNKNVAENTLLLGTHSSTAEKCNLEIRGDNSLTQIKEEPVDYEVIATQEVKHRKIVPGNSVRLDAHSSTVDKSTVRLKEDSFSNNIKEEPADYEFQ